MLKDAAGRVKVSDFGFASVQRQKKVEVAAAAAAAAAGDADGQGSSSGSRLAKQQQEGLELDSFAGTVLHQPPLMGNLQSGGRYPAAVPDSYAVAPIIMGLLLGGFYILRQYAERVPEGVSKQRYSVFNWLKAFTQGTDQEYSGELRDFISCCISCKQTPAELLRHRWIARFCPN